MNYCPCSVKSLRGEKKRKALSSERRDDLILQRYQKKVKMEKRKEREKRNRVCPHFLPTVFFFFYVLFSFFFLHRETNESSEENTIQLMSIEEEKEKFSPSTCWKEEDQKLWLANNLYSASFPAGPCEKKCALFSQKERKEPRLILSEVQRELFDVQ